MVEVRVAGVRDCKAGAPKIKIIGGGVEFSSTRLAGAGVGVTVHRR